MTPKDKVSELIGEHQMRCIECDGYRNAIIHAIITVNEILKSTPLYPSDVDWDDAGGTHKYYHDAQRDEAKNYWQEVKRELELL